MTKETLKDPMELKVEQSFPPVVKVILKQLSKLKVELTFPNRKLSCAGRPTILTPELNRTIEQHKPLLIAFILLTTKSCDIEDWFEALKTCTAQDQASGLIDCFHLAAWSKAEVTQMSRAYIQHLEYLKEVGHHEIGNAGLRIQYELADKIRLDYERQRLAEHS